MIGRRRRGGLTWAELQSERLATMPEGTPEQVTMYLLRSALIRYGHHDGDCSVTDGNTCDCGYTEACELGWRGG